MPATPAFSNPSFSPLQGAGTNRAGTEAGTANLGAAKGGSG